MPLRMAEIWYVQVGSKWQLVSPAAYSLGQQDGMENQLPFFVEFGMKVSAICLGKTF